MKFFLDNLDYSDCSGAITLVFVLATILSIVFGYRQKVELLAIPVTVLFAFPQLRSSMPGAPLGGSLILFACMISVLIKLPLPRNL